VPKHLIEIAQERKKVVPGALVASVLIDLLKDFLTGRLVEWGIERLGWLGTFLLNNPFAFLTLTVLVIIVWFAFVLARDYFKPARHSPILDVNENPIPQEISRKFMLIGISFCVVVGILVAYGSIRFHKATESRTTTIRFISPDGGWLSEWGQEIPPLGVRSIVNVSTLIPYHKPIHLMLIYRTNDMSVDEQDDTNIVKSNIISVADDPRLVIDVQLTQDFLRHAAHQQPGQAILPMKVALVFLPSRVKQEEICRISDAKKLGGGALVINGFPLPIKVDATKSSPQRL
jgi:hypothetical protein